MHLPWVNFRYMKDWKIEVLAVNVILENHVQKRTFIVIDKLMVVKLQRTFVKFVTVNTSSKYLFNQPGVDVIPSRFLIDLG